MMGKTHRLSAATGSLIISVLFKSPLKILVIGLIISDIHSRIADIDNPKSGISQKLKIISIIISIGQFFIRLFSNFFPRKIKKKIRSLIGHRGLSHSLLAVIIATLSTLAAAYYFTKDINEAALYAFYAMIGYISHLILDIFSNGVPVAIPFSFERLTLGKIKTGGLIDYLLFSFHALIITAILLVFYLPMAGITIPLNIPFLLR